MNTIVQSAPPTFLPLASTTPCSLCEDPDECATCRKFRCEHFDCGCVSSSFLGEELKAPAMHAISQLMRQNRELLDLSFQGFTVEDEYGCLQFLSGDLSPVFDKTPFLFLTVVLLTRCPSICFNPTR
jgi:hypothetical protein